MGTIYEQDDICIRKQLLCARLLGLPSNEDVYFYQGYDKSTNMFCELTTGINVEQEKPVKRIIAELLRQRKQNETVA